MHDAARHSVTEVQQPTSEASEPELSVLPEAMVPAHFHPKHVAQTQTPTPIELVARSYRHESRVQDHQAAPEAFHSIPQ
jgi:hypothetical protein